MMEEKKKKEGENMRKLFTGFLAVCLVLAAASALPAPDAAAASETAGSETEAAAPEQIIDLSGYDDDTLTALLEQVQTEVVDRGIERTAQIQIGTYVFGRDIPVGKYVLKTEQSDDSGYLALGAADDPEDEYPSKLYEYINTDEAFEAYITGEEGDWLLTQVPCTLTISAGVQFK